MGGSLTEEKLANFGGFEKPAWVGLERAGKRGVVIKDPAQAVRIAIS